MAITKLFPEFLSNSSIQFAPRRTFISSSYSGVTGSINVIVNRSHTQKDNIDMREGLTNEEGPQKFDENTFEGRRKQIYEGKKTPVGSGEIFSESTGSYNYDLQLGLLLDGANPSDIDENGEYDDILNFPPEYFKKEYVQLNLNFAHKGYSDLPMHPRNAYTSSIKRFVPGTDFLHTNYRRKEITRRVLDKSIEVGRPSLGWGYANYHCVNMFSTTYNTGSADTPAIVYNSPSNRYLPTDEFQIEFFLKMQNQPTGSGTILHLPGAFAVSVATGSNDGNIEASGLPLNYRLILQLGSQANVGNPPSGLDIPDIEKYPTGSLSYVSKDFLTASHWHHCCMRWSPTSNNSTGSFIIDGRSAGHFETPTSFTIDSMSQQVDQLFLGAYYTGTKANALKFFASTATNNQGPVYNQGVEKTTTSASPHPVGSFTNPLDGGEFHEVKISNKIRSLGFIRRNMGVSTGSSAEHLFHLPVLYAPNAPKNNYNTAIGDLSNARDSSTQHLSLAEFYENYPVPNRKSFDSPFNTHHANIGGFLNINAQAYLRDFATGYYPYLHMLSSSVREYSSCHEMTSSYGYHRYPEHKQRNLLILPCDNGNFEQKYQIYSASDYTGSVLFETSPNVCRIDNIGDFASNYDSKLCLVDEGWNYAVTDGNKSEGHGPKSPSTGYRPLSRGFKPPSVPGTKFFNPDAYGLIGDTEKASNMVSFFNIPILFYGNRIQPGSLEMKSKLYVSSSLTDPNAASDRRVEMRLVDDGYGNLIRANASGSLATKAFVGTVYYEDGLIALKSPHLYMMGEDHFEITFKGEQNLHMFEAVVPCSKTLYNSSSNPNYTAYAPSDRVNEEATEFVYLSGVNFHDSNMNVVAKARFSQPLVKRKEDEFLIRVKFDF